MFPVQAADPLIGATGENIQGVFAQAAVRKPVLFFIDEIDRLEVAGRTLSATRAGRDVSSITSPWP